MIRAYLNRGKKQKFIAVLFIFIVVLVLFVLRDSYQPALLYIRKFIFIILLSIITLFFGLRKFLKVSTTSSKLIILTLLAVFFGFLFIVGWHFKMYDYMKMYSVYNSLKTFEINELPLTQNERIQPLGNIFSMANESIGETKDVSIPHLVKINNENKWTMAIQPTEKYYWQGLTDNIEEVFAVSSTTPFPRFSSENRIPVTFSIGESLKFTRNTYNAVVQRFNFFQLFMLEPSDTYYMQNDEGVWVQVVSLIKWKGFLFPYPTFGGVMVIDNGEHHFKDYLERILIGKGTYISPKQIKNYAYLTKQNILAEKISRIQAESLKFLGGFIDPLPGIMETAVKIPKMPIDQNQQPYVTDFDFSKTTTGALSGLYHWFGLEPVRDSRTSLSYSVFIPGDGTDRLYYYDHATKKQGYAGVSAMPLKVVESRKEYDWNANTPVEFRPYIKNIAGKKRLFFMGTVSSISKNNEQQFDGSATPDIVLVDSEYRDVVWIDVKHPSQWDKTVYKQLNEAWRASEGIGYYFTDDEKNMNVIPQNIDSTSTIRPENANLQAIESLQKQIDSLKALQY